MRKGQTSRALMFATSLLAVVACGGEDDPNGGRTNTPGADGPVSTTTTEEQVRKILDQRRVDYGEALRTASLKLRDRLPDLAEIKQLEVIPTEEGKKPVYEKLVDEMIASTDFTRMMIKFWRDTLRIAQQGDIENNVNRDAAPLFAAQVTVEGRSFTELFTATQNTCPTFNGETSTFTPGNCALPENAIAGPTVGILTDPGLMSQYFANMGFRRVRFIQETFVCTKYPAEYSPAPVPMGNGQYTSPWPFDKITGKANKPDARVDFLDTKATICANCHSTMNHITPLFLNWDANGALRDRPQVKVPIPGEPAAQRSDYLPDGESLAWRNGQVITDMAGLGAAIAADPEVARCAVNRVWNYAMSRGDIINDLATIPTPVTQPYLDRFTAGGMKLKETMREVFKSEDFTKF